ncbi:MAG: cytochrome c [Bacteroidetes bacterium]|nr:cytochrome c [Bacteroidota bacterium]
MKKFSFVFTVIAFILAAICLSSFSFQQKEKFSLKESMERGKAIYTAKCMTCHMEAGEGTDGYYPPLAKSDYLMADKKRSIEQVLYGASGPMQVNGYDYEEKMPGFDFTDEQVSDVLNYVRNVFGNKGDALTPEEVKSARKK